MSCWSPSLCESLSIHAFVSNIEPACLCYSGVHHHCAALSRRGTDPCRLPKQALIQSDLLYTTQVTLTQDACLMNECSSTFVSNIEPACLCYSGVHHHCAALSRRGTDPCRLPKQALIQSDLLYTTQVTLTQDACLMNECSRRRQFC